MIEPQKRQAVITLHRQNKGIREISRILDIDVKTVTKIIREGGAVIRNARSDKIEIDESLLRKVHKKAGGYSPRIHEILNEEHGIKASYSTVTQRLREIGLGRKSSPRSTQLPELPGKEMQHDTSPYQLAIGGRMIHVNCSCLYLRYSKIRYVRFYRSFDRFAMKCFFDEALRFWGYCAKRCVIDNTHLAVWYGSGSRAVFTVEMENFAKAYGFSWFAHEINHSNRKAGVERAFRTINTNFFPGREFSSMDDLNRQAIEWATEKFAKRPHSKTGLIPIQTFETEKMHLIKLPDYIPFPCQKHIRVLDQYGYAALRANYFWVPEYAPDTKEKIKQVQIIEYASHIVIYRFPRLLELVRYELPAMEVKNSRFSPPEVNLRFKPKNRKRKSREEEKALREKGEEVSLYLDYILSKECRVVQKYYFIRRLYRLSHKMAKPLFIKSVTRALEHHVCDIEAIAKIATHIMLDKNTDHKITGDIQIDDSYMEREVYLKGRFCKEQEPDNLDLFDDMGDDDSGAPTLA